MAGYTLDQRSLDALRAMIQREVVALMPGRKRGKKWRASAGPGGGAAGALAIVTSTAPAASETSGVITPGSGVADRYEWDGTDLTVDAADDIMIYNASQEVGLTVGSVVTLMKIGDDWFAEYLEVADYLRALSGSGKVLYRSGATGDPIEWQSEACP